MSTLTLLGLSLALLLLVVPGTAFVPLYPNVGEVKGYVKLSSWGNSSLYQLLTDSNYETEPLLVHLVGSRYGESLNYRLIEVQLIHVRRKQKCMILAAHINLGQ